MTATTAIRTTPYDNRVNLVKETIRQHEKLNDKAAYALAVQILQTLDHIPEKIR